MSKYKELGKNTLLVFIGNIGSKMIVFLMLPFYTKWLSVEEYGTSDNVMIYVSLLLGIVTLSISDSIFIFPKDQEFSKQRQYFSSGLFYSGLFLLVTGLCLYGIKDILITVDILKSISANVGFIYFLIIAFFLQTFIQQFSRSINKINVYAISGVILTLLTAGLSFFLVPQYGLNGFFTAQICSLFIASIYSLIHSRAYCYFSLNAINLKKYRQMTKYSIPLIPNAVMWWLVGSLNRPLMEEYLGMHAVGLFAIAYKFPSLINVLFTVFLVSWQISVIDEYQNVEYEKFYNRIFKLVFSLLSLCVIMLCLLGKPLTMLVADNKFHDAYKYIPILSLSALFSSVSGFVGANFSATRESKYYFYSSVWGAIAAVILNLILIPLWGLYGAVIAIVLSNFVMALSRIKYSWNRVKITNIYFYLSILSVCLSVVLAISFLESLKLIIGVVSGGIVLFIFLVRNDITNGLQLIKMIIKKSN
jgi:O-antigen/teichoic acid export membrane protein